MKRLVLAGIVAIAACAPSPDPAPMPAPPPLGLTEGGGPLNIVVMIGDGTGLTYWSALKIYSSEPLAIESFPVVGLLDTEAAGSKITDSAAGATAFSIGVRTYNGAMGVGPDTSAIPTVLEVAERRGWATGLVATSRITHATPGAFAAHVPSRLMYDEIARQMTESGVDVLLGGGTNFFDPAVRDDSLDLIGVLDRRGVFVASPQSFRELDLDTVQVLYGLFGERDMPTAPTRAPSLSEMTEAALDVLSRDPDGFFLMVEASQIDWLGHDNAPLPAVLAEVQDFNWAIQRALTFQDRHPNTLVVVLADHSTGGFSIAADSMGVLRGFYTTEGHTGEMVPVFARGPGAAAFGGVMDNDRVGRILLHYVREGETEGPTPE